MLVEGQVLALERAEKHRFGTEMHCFGTRFQSDPVTRGISATPRSGPVNRPFHAVDTEIV